MMQTEVADGFDRLVQAINAVDAKTGATGVVIPIESEDPETSPTQNVWVLETVSSSQECGGFFGAMPVIEDSQTVTHQLSVRTDFGIKRLELI